jgi:hypothetical protein
VEQGQFFKPVMVAARDSNLGWIGLEKFLNNGINGRLVASGVVDSSKRVSDGKGRNKIAAEENCGQQVCANGPGLVAIRPCQTRPQR